MEDNFSLLMWCGVLCPHFIELHVHIFEGIKPEHLSLQNIMSFFLLLVRFNAQIAEQMIPGQRDINTFTSVSLCCVTWVVLQKAIISFFLTHT